VQENIRKIWIGNAWAIKYHVLWFARKISKNNFLDDQIWWNSCI